MSSDTEMSSDFEDDSISVCHEFDELIKRCEVLEEGIEQSYKSLERVKELLTDTIIVQGRDFDEVLDELHMKAMNTINEGGDNIFGRLLLAL